MANRTLRQDDSKAIPQVRQAILAALPEIVDAIIRKALEGSYLHAKFLCELAGIECGPEDSASSIDAEAVVERTVREMLGAAGS